MNPATALLILRVLDMLVAGLELAPALKRRASGATARIKVMIEEDRDPTPEEWDELLVETDNLTDSIRAAVEAKR